MERKLWTIVPDQIWGLEHEIRMLPGVYLPARMLLIRLNEDSLALWSPVPMTDAHAAEIAAHGSVDVIIAPNNYHHLYLRPAMERYPDAEVWAAPGLPEKRSNLELPNVLTADAAPRWADALQPFFMDGAPRMQESVFVHHATRTLVVADALFNLQTTRGLMSPLMFRLLGSYGRPMQSRTWRSIVKDREAMRRSTRAVLDAEFERIIMAHGTVIDAFGHAVFQEATSWLPTVD